MFNIPPSDKKMKVYRRGFFLVIKFTSTHAQTYKTQTDSRTLKYNGERFNNCMKKPEVESKLKLSYSTWFRRVVNISWGETPFCLEIIEYNHAS